MPAWRGKVGDVMAVCPFARWEPLAGRSGRRITPVRLTLHTAVSSARDLYGGGKGPGGTYAHFYVAEDGTLYQYQDTGLMAQADLDGNSSTISVETWDGGREQPWNAAQVATLGRLFAWIVATHSSVPDRIATPDNTAGLAWHRLGVQGNFGAFNPNDRATWSARDSGQRWTKARGKLCPWSVRIAQIDDVYQASKGEEELTPEEHNYLLNINNMLQVPGYPFGYPAATHNSLGEFWSETTARLAALQAAVDALAASQGVEGLSGKIDEAIKDALADVSITLSAQGGENK